MGSGNGGLNGVALIEGTVKFVLNIPDGLQESDISNVYFTYGTSPNENTLGSTTDTPTTSGTPTTGGVRRAGGPCRCWAWRSAGWRRLIA